MKKLMFALFMTALMHPVFASEMTAVTQAVPMSEADENQAVYINDDSKIMPKTEQEENSQQSYTIHVIYPQISGENLSEPAQNFNKIISDMVQEELQRFKKYVAADMPHMKTLPEEARKNTFNMDYDIDVVKVNEKNLVSVRLSIEGFQAGRAHPYHKHQVLNFDLNNGNLLTLSDLFKPRAKYLNAIAKYSTKKLDEKLTDKSFITEGTKPIASNYKNWNLENDSILITFDEYQVAPYSYGTQEVEIPYDVLASLISNEAAIYPCVKNPEVCSSK